MTVIKGGVNVPALDEPLPQEDEATYEAAWAQHPFRDHPRFSLARPDERGNGITLLVLVDRSTWGPGAMRTPPGVVAGRPRAPW